MREQTFELHIERRTKEQLDALSYFGTAFYNAALAQRKEHPIPLNRTKQMADVGYLYSKAGIESLPRSIAYQLLLELDVVTYTPARSQERTLDCFHALAWAGDDIEVDNDGILLQPNIRLPLPDFSDPSGILTRVRVKTIIRDTAIVQFHWKAIPGTGPGRDRKRAFGYTPVSGALESYVLGIADGLMLRYRSKT